MTMRALVDALTVAGHLTGTVPFECCERTTLVRRDPDVHHRVLATGLHRSGGAVAGVVGDPLDHRVAAVVEPPTEVVVVVPLHQRPAVIDELGIVERPCVGDEHRGHQRAFAAVDAVDERLRLARVEPHVVEDEAGVDVVLEAGAGVADRPVAERTHGRHVGELRELGERVASELLGSCLLVGGDALDT